MLRERLIAAQDTSIEFFKAIEAKKLILPGKTEAQLNDDVCNLAAKEFGITQHWHKKIVRAGENTLSIYTDDPPDRTIGEDEILFIDLGPIVNGYEADIGRTY